MLGSVKDLLSLRLDKILERHVLSHLVGNCVWSGSGVLLLRAMVTGVGFLEIVRMMNANVRAEITRTDEFPVANVTLVRFLSRVSENV